MAELQEGGSSEHSGDEDTGSEGSGSGSGSFYTGEEGEEEEEESSQSEETTSEEDEEEEDEPVLKYKRFAKEAVMSISQGAEGEKNIICCIAVHPKFLALGTFDGTIKLLDHSGTYLKDRVYSLHRAQVNQISLDEEGEFLASCSDDGKVSIIGLLTTKYNNTVSFDKQVKSVAIHPHFGRSTNRVFVAGTDKVMMVEERRWPLGNKTVDLHGGYGVISTIKWKENLIAWANEKMVVVYDTTLRERITSISFEEESSAYLPCNLYWKSAGILLVGRGHIVKVVSVVDGEGEEQQPSYSTDMDATLRRKKFMAISAQNTFPKSLVCGVVPLFKGEEWMLVVLGYDAECNQQASIQNGLVPPPHLVVVTPGQYIKEQKSFEAAEPKARDKLLPKGYNYCRCEEYHVECVLGEDRFYILTPIDIILAQKRDSNDHIDWLLKRKHFEDAMQYAYNPDVSKVLHPGKLQEIGIEYIYHLIKTKKFKEAAKKCSEVLGSGDRKRWEDVIFSFIQSGQLKVIRPFIPITEPQLCAAIYELVLNTFLKEDCEVLYKLTKVWPSSLYSAQAVLNAVQDKLFHEPKNSELLKVKASLHEDLGQYDEALKIYLRQRHSEVFELIKERKLYSALVENLLPLMRLNMQEAVKVMVDCRAEVVPQRVVKELEAPLLELYLHRYLDHLFERDPKCGGVYHERQVELYAKFDSEKLLPFLRSCNDIPLQNALTVCEHYDRHKEMVYLLGRMGNPRAALELIIKKLQDVDMAIEFAMEEGDEDLWELLISLSIHKPKFITGLLNNVGTHIDPTKLIQQIPEHTEIPDLGISLVKLLQDFRVQVNLREGCKKILVKDRCSDLPDLWWRDYWSR